MLVTRVEGVYDGQEAEDCRQQPSADTDRELRDDIGIVSGAQMAAATIHRHVMGLR